MSPILTDRSFTFKDIFTMSWGLFTTHFTAIATITLIVYIPINIILFFIPVEPDFAGFRVYFRVIQLFELFIGILATMATAYLVQQAIDGKEIQPKEAFVKAISRWGASVGTHILMSIFLVGLLILLVVPAIVFYVYWIFVSFVIVLKDKTGNEALRYSKQLVTGQWWRVTGYALVLGVLALLASFVVGIFHFFVPIHIVTSVLVDTSIDIVISFFIVAWTVFFLHVDRVKISEEKELLGE